MNDKETLEEGYNRIFDNRLDRVLKAGFIAGAKWQAERMYSEEELQQKIDAHLEVAKDLWLSTIKEQKRMYSEEEVKNIISKLARDCYFMQEPNQNVAKWFEQFKKK